MISRSLSWFVSGMLRILDGCPPSTSCAFHFWERSWDRLRENHPRAS